MSVFRWWKVTVKRRPGVLLRYLNSIVSKEGLGIRLSCQVEDGRFAPAFCSSHQQSICPVLAVGIALSKHICHKRKKKLPNLNSHFISICLCWPCYFVAISRHTSCHVWPPFLPRSDCQLLSLSCIFPTHQGQTAHTWPPSYCAQIQLQIPALPSLSESYNLPAPPQQPQGPEGLKESWIQEIGLRKESEKSSLQFCRAVSYLHLFFL